MQENTAKKHLPEPVGDRGRVDLLDQVAREVVEDARQRPEDYADETVVPEGGE